MLYNKREVKKFNDKKVLHKVKKQWIIVSVALLMAVGGGLVTSHSINVRADAQNGQQNTLSLGTKPLPKVGSTSADNSNQLFKRISQTPNKTVSNPTASDNHSSVVSHNLGTTSNVYHITPRVRFIDGASYKAYPNDPSKWHYTIIDPIANQKQSNVSVPPVKIPPVNVQTSASSVTINPDEINLHDSQEDLSNSYRLINNQNGIDIQLGSNHNINGNQSDDGWVSPDGTVAPEFDYVSQPTSTQVQYYDDATKQDVGNPVTLNGYYDERIMNNDYTGLPQSPYPYRLSNHMGVYYYGHIPNDNKIMAPVSVALINGTLPIILKTYRIDDAGKLTLIGTHHECVNVSGYPNINQNGFKVSGYNADVDLNTINQIQNSNGATLIYHFDNHTYRLANLPDLQFSVGKNAPFSVNNFNDDGWNKSINNDQNNNPDAQYLNQNFQWANGTIPIFTQYIVNPDADNNYIFYNQILYRVIMRNQYGHAYTWQNYALPDKVGNNGQIISGINVSKDQPAQIQFDMSADEANVKKILGESGPSYVYYDNHPNDPYTFNYYDLLAYDEKLNKFPESDPEDLEHGIVPDPTLSSSRVTVYSNGQLDWQSNVPNQADNSHFYYETPVNNSGVKIGSFVVNQPYVPTYIKFIDSQTGHTVPFQMDGQSRNDYLTKFSQGAFGYIVGNQGVDGHGKRANRVYFVGEYADANGRNHWHVKEIFPNGVKVHDPTFDPYMITDPNTGKLINNGKGYIDIPTGYQWDSTAQKSHVISWKPWLTVLGDPYKGTDDGSNYPEIIDSNHPNVISWPKRQMYTMPKGNVHQLPTNDPSKIVYKDPDEVPQSVLNNGEYLESNDPDVTNSKDYDNPDGSGGNGFAAGQDNFGTFHYYNVYPIYVDKLSSNTVNFTYSNPVTAGAQIKFIYTKGGYTHQIGEPVDMGVNKNRSSISLRPGSQFWNDMISGPYKNYHLNDYQYQNSSDQQIDFNHLKPVLNQKGYQGNPLYGTYTVYLTSPGITVHYRMNNTQDGHQNAGNEANDINPSSNYDIEGSQLPVDDNGHLNLDDNTNNLSYDNQNNYGTPFSINGYINSINNNVPNGQRYKYASNLSVPAFTFNSQNVYIYLDPKSTPRPQPQNFENYVQFIYEKNSYQHNLGPKITVSGGQGNHVNLVNNSRFYQDAINALANYHLAKYRYVDSTDWNDNPVDTDILNRDSDGKTYKIYVTSPDIRVHYRWDTAKDGHSSGQSVVNPNKAQAIISDDKYDIKGLKMLWATNGYIKLNDTNNLDLDKQNNLYGTPFAINNYIDSNLINRIEQKLGQPVLVKGYYSVPAWSFDRQNVYVYLAPNPQKLQNYVQFVYEKNGYKHNLGTRLTIAGSQGHHVNLENGSRFYQDAENKLKQYHLSKYRYVGSDVSTDVLNSSNSGITYYIYVTTPDIKIHYRLDQDPSQDIKDSKTPVDRSGGLILGDDNNELSATPFDITPYLKQSVINANVPTSYQNYKIDHYQSVNNWNYDKQNVYIYLKAPTDYLESATANDVVYDHFISNGSVASEYSYENGQQNSYTRSEEWNNGSYSPTSWSTDDPDWNSIAPASYSTVDDVDYHLTSGADQLPSGDVNNYQSVPDNQAVESSLKPNSNVSYSQNVYYVPDSYSTQTQSAAVRIIIHYLSASNHNQSVANSTSVNSIVYSRAARMDNNNSARDQNLSSVSWSTNSQFGSLPASAIVSGMVAVSSSDIGNSTVALLSANGLMPNSTSTINEYVYYQSSKSSSSSSVPASNSGKSKGSSVTPSSSASSSKPSEPKSSSVKPSNSASSPSSARSKGSLPKSSNSVPASKSNPSTSSAMKPSNSASSSNSNKSKGSSVKPSSSASSSKPSTPKSSSSSASNSVPASKSTKSKGSSVKPSSSVSSSKASTPKSSSSKPSNSVPSSSSTRSKGSLPKSSNSVPASKSNPSTSDSTNSSSSVPQISQFSNPSSVTSVTPSSSVISSSSNQESTSVPFNSLDYKMKSSLAKLTPSQSSGFKKFDQVSKRRTSNRRIRFTNFSSSDYRENHQRSRNLSKISKSDDIKINYHRSRKLPQTNEPMVHMTLWAAILSSLSVIIGTLGKVMDFRKYLK